MRYNGGNELPVYIGGWYIQELNYNPDPGNYKKFDQDIPEYIFTKAALKQ